ncbi:MAG: tRNA 2-thiouridine(34) synthase MnmA, partial [Coriobacteriaceae bacterium]|nr:tRNA 2-thiouridine(34) synthase MnmA [Coriobacteriaceae bacterium]
EAFERGVIAPYADAYAAGETPNPCIECNARVKFDELLRRASLLGAETLATGHYARVVDSPDGPRVARARDGARDQSYFLYRTTPQQLARLVFPVGGMLKAEVRAYAAAAGLPSAERPESREACFAPDARARDELVRARHPEALTPGSVVDATGAPVGRHRGIAHYTVGQRKGLGSGGGPTRYIVRIDPATNTLVAGDRADLAVTRIEAVDPVWRPVAPEAPLTARVRYRGDEVPCTASVDDDGRLLVHLHAPLLGVSPGQAVVCYAGDIVIGGGRIGEAR